MHGIVATSLFRPLSSYKPQPDNDAKVETNIDSHSASHWLELETDEPKTSIVYSPKNLQVQNSGSQDLEQYHEDAEAGEQDCSQTKFFKPSFHGCPKTTNESREIFRGAAHISRKRSISDSTYGHQGTHPYISRSSDVIHMSGKTRQNVTSLRKEDINLLQRAITGSRNTKSRSFEFLSHISLNSSLTASSLSLAEIHEARKHGLELKSGEICDKNMTETSSKSALCLKSLRAVFSFSVFGSWSSTFFIFSYMLSRSANFTAVYVAAYATQKGMDKTQAAILLAIYGGVDMVSRIFFGYIGDLHLTKSRYIIALTCICAGVVSCFGNLYSTFPLLVFCSSTIGFFGHVALSLNTNNIIEQFGMGNLGPFLSQSSLLLSFAYMIQFPLLGLFIESTGQMVIVFYYVAVCYILSTSLILIHEAILKVVSRKTGKCKTPTAMSQDHQDLQS